MAGIFSETSLNNRVNETILSGPARKEVYCGYRPVPPWPRARWFLGEKDTAYPAEGYYTTGYPEADVYLRKPQRYGLPMQLGSLGLDTTMSVVGAPRTPLGMAALAAFGIASAFAVWKLAAYALKG